jgi:hypothetical protein
MKKIFVLLLSAIVLIIFFDGCKKEDDGEDEPSSEEIFDKNYTGSLNLFFSNSFPQFQSETNIVFTVNKFGDMLFDQGTLFYSGTSDNGQAKLQREGELTIAPYGKTVKNGDEIMFEVDENTVVVETYKMWVWDGQQWIQQVNESITDTWNNGLSFSYLEAIADGSVVEVSNANGTVRWTFAMMPDLGGK